MALQGVKVLEFMGAGPGSMCGTILADFGAAVTVIDKTFRPCVLEKLGLGPEVLLKLNPRLIYARLTGHGQNSFYKNKAGHDINFVAVSGILSLFKRKDQPPMPPTNILASLSGGSLMCAFGILLALYERTISGKGQVVDNSMTKSLSYISTWLFKSRKLPIWLGETGSNIFDGGSHFYQSYETKDNKFMAVGALEPHFYANLIKGLNLCEEKYSQYADYEMCKTKFKEIFKMKTQEEWCHIFEELDACVTPVFVFDNVDSTNYHTEDKTFYRNYENQIIPQPASTLSRTRGISSGLKKQPKPGEHSVEILQELGYSNNQIKKLIKSGDVYALTKSLL